MLPGLLTCHLIPLGRAERWQEQFTDILAREIAPIRGLLEDDGNTNKAARQCLAAGLLDVTESITRPCP